MPEDAASELGPVAWPSVLLWQLETANRHRGPRVSSQRGPMNVLDDQPDAQLVVNRFHPPAASSHVERKSGR